jgi:hypothetical protein
LGSAKCDRRARSNTRTLRAQPTQHRSERNAPTWGPSQSPRNPQRLSASNHVKTKDNLRPNLMCGLNQWIGGDQQPSCSPKTRRGGSRRISPNFPSYCVSPPVAIPLKGLKLKRLYLPPAKRPDKRAEAAYLAAWYQIERASAADREAAVLAAINLIPSAESRSFAGRG